MSEMNSIYIPWKGWRIVRQLGRGSFGTVYEIHRDQYGVVEKAAMKVIPVPHDEASLDDLYTSGYDDVGVQTWCQSRQREILSEYALMRKLKGAYNIVECEDIEVVPRTDGPGSYIFIRMELLTPLKKYLRTTALSQDEIIRLGMEMCRALSACEDNNVVHRDVKPDNIFVSDYGVFKLGDFGIARLLEHTTKATMAGAIQFMAPEILRGEEYDKYVDIYSLGLVMYWLLNRGRMPFLPLGTVLTADQSAEAQRRRLSGERLPAPADASEELAEIVLKACAFNKKDRYASAKEMLHDLELLKHGVTQPIHEKRKEPEPVRYSAKNAQMPDNDDMTVGLFPGVNAVNNAAIRKQNMPTVYCESDEETVSEPEAVVLSVDQQQQNTPVLTNINKAKKRRLLQKIETWTDKPCRIWEKVFLVVIMLLALYEAVARGYIGTLVYAALAIVGIY